MRLHIHGHRIHHGLTGLILIIIGVGLMLHDRRDFPWPLRDRPQDPISAGIEGMIAWHAREAVREAERILQG